MFSHTIIRGYRDSSGVTLQATEVVQADTETNFDGAVAGAAVDAEVDLALTRGNLKCVAIQCDIAITIKTNDSTTPVDTVTVAAGNMIVWSLAKDGLPKCPVAHDVTKLFITGPGSGPAGVLKVRALSDQTP